MRLEDNILNDQWNEVRGLLMNERQDFLCWIKPLAPERAIRQQLVRIPLIIPGAVKNADPSQGVRADSLKGANAALNVGFRKPNFDWSIAADLQEVNGALHGMPHKSFGADSPRSCSAACKTVYVLGGNCFRHFHVGTADGLPTRVISLTALGPPSSAITSETV